MEKINRQRAPKGTVTVRQKGNSFEARVTLELVTIMKGVDNNPRLSRTAKTEEDAKKRLGEHIVDVLLETKKIYKQNQILSEECAKELEKFEEYTEERHRRKIEKLADNYTLLPNMAREWLKWKSKQINPVTEKTIGPKTIESYVNTLHHIEKEFPTLHIYDITKEYFENYINTKRKKSSRTAQEIYLMVRSTLNYSKDERKLLSEVPNFNISFPKKRRKGKTKIPYLPEKRQYVWLDVLEQDKRQYSLLFATLLQTGMRPEEGCGLKWNQIFFNSNYLTVTDAHKEVAIYNDDFEVIGHERIDDDLKTPESERNIPLTQRLKLMLLNLKKERKEECKASGKQFKETDYVFLNQNGDPYVPERLDTKIKQLIKKYNLEHMTVYGLRHSFATLMSSRGMDKEVLKELMGHSDYETTNFYYVHISDERKQQECNKIDKQMQKERQKYQNNNNIKRYTLKRTIKVPKIA